MKINYQKVIDFIDLFTAEQRAEWANNGSAPDWVVMGIGWFMNQDPGHQELMERLKDS